MATLPELLAQAEIIRTAQNVDENTAQRIGKLYNDIIVYFSNNGGTGGVTSHLALSDKNQETDFQHATQAQHDRWTNNYSYKIENTSVSTWVASTAYAGYGFQSQINIADLSEFDSVNVVFGLLDAISGNYAPAIEIYSGYILVFAKVNATITIPTIEITKIDL